MLRLSTMSHKTRVGKRGRERRCATPPLLHRSVALVFRAMPSKAILLEGVLSLLNSQQREQRERGVAIMQAGEFSQPDNIKVRTVNAIDPISWKRSPDCRDSLSRSTWTPSSPASSILLLTATSPSGATS